MRATSTVAPSNFAAAATVVPPEASLCDSEEVCTDLGSYVEAFASPMVQGEGPLQTRLDEAIGAAGEAYASYHVATGHQSDYDIFDNYLQE